MTKTSEMMVEIKSVEGDNTPEGSFTGILSMYGNVDLGGDIVEQNAFAESIKAKGLKRTLLWQHDWNEPIGQFTVKDTESALAIDGSFNLDTVRGKEAYSLLKRGDINGLSIGYSVEDYKYDEDGIRHLLKCDLWEGSIVTFPMNPLCQASAKSRQMDELKELVGGLSKKQRRQLKDAIDDLVETISDELRTALDKICEGENEDEKESEEETESEEQSEEKEESEELTDEEVEEGLKAVAESIRLLKSAIH